MELPKSFDNEMCYDMMPSKGISASHPCISSPNIPHLFASQLKNKDKKEVKLEVK